MLEYYNTMGIELVSSTINEEDVKMTRILSWEETMKKLKSDYGFASDDLIRFSIALPDGRKRYGYVSSDGDIVVSPQFYEAHDFDGNFAVVRFYEKYGVIDYFGNYVIEPDYEEIYNIKGEYFFVKLGDFFTIARITTDGTEEAPESNVEYLPYRFNNLLYAKGNDSIVMVELPNEKGVLFDLINMKIISGEYDDLYPLTDEGDFFVGELNDKKVLINSNGCLVIPESFDTIEGEEYPFELRRETVDKEEIALLFPNNKLIGWYETIHYLSNNLYYVGDGNLMNGGFLKSNGEWFIEGPVEFTDDVVNNIFTIEKDGLIRLVDIVTPRFLTDWCKSLFKVNFVKDIYTITTDKGRGYIKSDGRMLVDEWFDMDSDTSFELNGFLLVKKNGKVALLNNHGDLTEWFDEIKKGEQLPFPARIGECWGYIGWKDKICKPVTVIPFLFHNADCFSGVTARVEVTPGKYNFINPNGQVVYDSDFDEAYPYIRKYDDEGCICIAIVGKYMPQRLTKKKKLMYACVTGFGKISPFKYKTVDEAARAIYDKTESEIFE